MKQRPSKRRLAAFTRSDALLIIGALFVLAIVLLPMFSKPPKAYLANCGANQRQIVLAFQMWVNDRTADALPFTISTNRGGSLEYAFTGEHQRHFQILTNELLSAKVLVCPADREQRMTTNLVALARSNVSYFVGLDADYRYLLGARDVSVFPLMLGDRNVSTNGNMHSGLLVLNTTNSVQWTKDIHKERGVATMLDCTMKVLTKDGLQELLQDQFNHYRNGFPLRFSLP